MSERRRRYFVYVCARCRMVCQSHMNTCPECGGTVNKEKME